MAIKHWLGTSKPHAFLILNYHAKYLNNDTTVLRFNSFLQNRYYCNVHLQTKAVQRPFCQCYFVGSSATNNKLHILVNLLL